MVKTREERLKYCKEWYIKNRDKKIKYTKEYQKINNYGSEKTREQRKIRWIKRKTRQKYPIFRHFCEFCGNKATEHHHNTKPIEANKFNFCCHDCHMNKANKMATKGG